MARIQYKRYALINQQGIIWEGITRPTKASLFHAYKGIAGGGHYAAIADGWNVKSVTIHFTL